MAKLTRKDAESIIKSKKIVSASVSWKAGGRGTYKLEANCLVVETREILSIKGYIGRDNYGFALLYNNIPIRKYTKHQRHIWKGKTYTQPHKHVWDEVTEDKEVYIPTDIDPKNDVSVQFMSFCQECNIDLRGGYQTFLVEEKKE